MGTTLGEAAKGEEGDETIYSTYLGIGGVPQPITQEHRESYPDMPKSPGVCGWYRLIEDAVKHIPVSTIGIEMCTELCKGRCGGIRVACLREIQKTLRP